MSFPRTIGLLLVVASLMVAVVTVAGSAIAATH
jgi:hypothetical protein